MQITRARLLVLAVVLVPGVLLAGCGGESAAPHQPRVLVLGIDGMDPAFLLRYMRENKMPAFSRLAAAGTFVPLGTSMPPQSPVAWSNFITGMNPGGHGIFDFLRHDERNFVVADSTAFAEKASRILGIPVGGGMKNLRRGRAFWEYLEDRGIPATVFRVPANFPPVGRTARTFSGMGTPDMTGSKGTFTFYTDAPPADAADVSGGVVVKVEINDHVVKSELIGPPNPFREDEALVRIPLTIYVDPERKAARIDVDAARIVLKPGEWSDWVRVQFPLLPAGLSGASGIVRFFLKSLQPGLQLYASPVNVDPADPAIPLSTPAAAVTEESSALGAFYTQGMPVDTKAFEWGVLGADEFLMQAQIVLKERERMLEYELARFDRTGGFLFFYFCTVDLTNHMMWASGDPKHPGHPKEVSPRAARAMEMLYLEMDRILSGVMERLGKDDLLIVMSDHGFAPYYRQVHLNNWLARERFLALFDPANPKGQTLRGDVDWLQTSAYAIGFNGIYLNLQGRQDIPRVTLAQKDKVLAEIERKLLRLRDPQSGRPVVSRVYRAEEIYSGEYLSRAPDLTVGYARGFRGSNETALGSFGPDVITDNLDRWSGDHMIAAEEVPGILLVNRKVQRSRPSLVDLPVTILETYGIDRPHKMVGRSIFRANDDAPVPAKAPAGKTKDDG